MRMPCPSRLAFPGLLLAAGLSAASAIGCRTPAADRALPQRLSESTASLRIERFERSRQPTLSPSVSFPVVESTPPGVWEALYLQTFRVTDGLFEYETYALTLDEVAQLGAGLRGPGVVDFALGDVDRDDEPDLAFASGSRSGLTRFGIGVIDRPVDNVRGALRQRRVPFSYRDPVRFGQSERGLEVWDVNRDIRLGRLVPAGARVRFMPESDLPRSVRERFLEPRL